MARLKVDDPLARAAVTGGRTRSTNGSYTGIQGKRDVSAVASLSRSLGGLQAGFAELSNVNAAEKFEQDEQDKVDDRAEGSVAYKKSKVNLGNAVRDGLIDAGASPAYREGYGSANLRVLATQYTGLMQERFGDTPSIGEDSAAFNSAEQAMFQQFAQENFANAPYSDAQIMDNFLNIRDSAKATLQQQLISRNNANIKIKRTELFNQETTELLQAGKASGKMDEAIEAVNVLTTELRKDDPTSSSAALEQITENLVQMSIASNDPKYLKYASKVIAGTGTLDGTLAFKQVATQARRSILRETETRRRRSNAQANRARANQERKIIAGAWDRTGTANIANLPESEALAALRAMSSTTKEYQALELAYLKRFGDRNGVRVAEMVGDATDVLGNDNSTALERENALNILANNGASTAVLIKLHSLMGNKASDDANEVGDEALAAYKDSVKTFRKQTTKSMAGIVKRTTDAANAVLDDPDNLLGDVPERWNSIAKREADPGFTRAKYEKAVDLSKKVKLGTSQRLITTANALRDRLVDSGASEINLFKAQLDTKGMPEAEQLELIGVKMDEVRAAMTETYLKTIEDPLWQSNVRKKFQAELKASASNAEDYKAKVEEEKIANAESEERVKLKREQLQRLLKQAKTNEVLSLAADPADTAAGLKVWKQAVANRDARNAREEAQSAKNATLNLTKNIRPKRVEGSYDYFRASELAYAKVALGAIRARAKPLYVKAGSFTDSKGVVTEGGNYVKLAEGKELLEYMKGIKNTKVFDEFSERFGLKMAQALLAFTKVNN